MAPQVTTSSAGGHHGPNSADQAGDKDKATHGQHHQHAYDSLEALKGTFRHMANLVFGIGMSLGLALSGMTTAGVANGFFDLSIWFTGRQSAFAPDLPVVFATALLTHALIFWIVVKKWMNKPLLGNQFHIPTNKIIDSQLVIGAVLFGVGWALSGLCPGPVVAASFSGSHVAIVTAAFMFMGFGLVHFYRAYKDHSAHHAGGVYGLITSVAQHGTLEYALALSALLGMIYMWKEQVTALPVPILGVGLSTRVLGGIILGTTIGLTMVINGNILGNAGIIGGLVAPQTTDKHIRMLFILGMGLGSSIAQRYFGIAFNTTAEPSMQHMLGGLLVGIGAALANGCTSGHGICGVTRMSNRSLIATGTFMASAFAVSTLLQLATSL